MTARERVQLRRLPCCGCPEMALHFCDSCLSPICADCVTRRDHLILCGFCDEVRKAADRNAELRGEQDREDAREGK
jgi:hypothetical protein